MRHRGDAGQVLPLIAVCLAVLLGFGGLSADVGYWEYHQREQQSATDAAALGGAQQLLYDGCPDQTAATTAAQNDAANSGFANGGNVKVTVQNPPSSGPYDGTSCAVDVVIQDQNIAQFFTKLKQFGLTSGITESTHAVATVSANNPGGCIYLTSASTTSIFNGDTVNAPYCNILINDTATFNGDPHFDANGIFYAGGTPIENGTTFTKASPAPMLPVANPCPEIAGCAYAAANPASTSNCGSLLENGVSNITIQPGCYNSFTLNGCSNVTFAPGTYVFNGSTVINGTNGITGSGVTLYVTANGTPPTFNGTGVSLSPPSTGNLTGVLYYQVPSNTSSPIFNGSSMQLSGLIYAPGATNAIFNGTNGGYLVIVAGAATFNGSNAYDLASPPPGGSLIRQAVLAE